MLKRFMGGASLGFHLALLATIVTPTAFANDEKPATSTVEVKDKKLIPVADFFRSPNLGSVSVSPDGKTIAMLMGDPDGNKFLALYDVATNTPSVLARYKEQSVSSFNWVNSNRIVYSLSATNKAPGEITAGGGLIAVDIDGKNERLLIQRVEGERTLQRVLDPQYRLYRTKARQETPDIYVAKAVDFGGRDIKGVDLFKLNTLDGTLQSIPRPCDAVSWYLDQNGEPRLVECRNDGVITTRLKTQDNKFETLFSTVLMEENGVQPINFDKKGNLYVTALINNDTRALFKYDIEKREMAKEPLVNLKGYDYEGSLITNPDTETIIGVHYITDLPGTVWLDEEWKKLQSKIDDLLPGRVNRIQKIKNSSLLYINSFSDIDPGTSYLMDTKTNKFTLIGQSRPWINPKQMAYVDPIKVKARDGLTIPGYITLPQGQSKNLPMVVLVHGGPNVRGEYWGWESQAQFLASRGYAVLQVDYRGSTGYGLKHESAGWRQWGLTMQDDVTDATRWAIQQGFADPKRICIAGASYGGYAALWGLIKEPELYRCGISWVGVTDISFRYSMTWSDSNDLVEKFFLPKKVGSLPEFQAQFDATSPVVHAAKLKQPLILAYGGLDRRVPIAHGTRFMSAIKGHNDKVQWIEYPNEGHGWRKLENNVDFWTKVEKFLEQNLR